MNRLFCFLFLAVIAMYGCSLSGNTQSVSSSSEDDQTIESSDSSGEDPTPQISSSSSTPVVVSSSSIAASSSSSSRASSSSVAPAPQYPTLTQGAQGVSKGWASRYWDGCKANCSWSGKAQALGSNTRCKTCSSNGTTEIAANDNNKSACDGGNSYTCFDQTPYRVNDNLAYAFAATPGGGSDCGKCYQIQFDGGFEHGTPYGTHAAIKGKTLIVISSNIGGDVQSGQFDIMIPGGGVGAFDAFSNQIGVTKNQLGKQYGGLLSDCETELNYANGSLTQYQKCLTDKCNVFTNATLKAGCNMYSSWFMAANNPTLLYKQVDCPQYLIDKYKATMF